MRQTNKQTKKNQPISATMAICGRKSRPKLLLFFICASLFGYFIFHRNSEVSRANRRGVLSDQIPEEDNELLRRPVYEKPALDPNALGELGKAVKLELSGEEKRKEEESLQKHQINTYISDKISLHRRLPERWNPL